jgi:hypothetical protein
MFLCEERTDYCIWTWTNRVTSKIRKLFAHDEERIPAAVATIKNNFGTESYSSGFAYKVTYKTVVAKQWKKPIRKPKHR